MRRLILIALLVSVPAWVSAQRNSGAHYSGAPDRRTGVSAPHSVHTSFGPQFGLSRFSPPLALASGVYYDALLDAGYPVAAEPPVIIVQPGIMQPAVDSRREAVASPAQPLMIELQGGRYVRVSGEENSGAETIDREVNARGADLARNRVETPPAVLVFRDGHREEVSDYTITDGVLYTSGDLYKDGSWTRTIKLSSLNLSETVESNQSRGVPFQLPTAPNVVMVRP